MEDQRFGTVIRAVRIRRGWRQSDLATAADVSRATISRLERGHMEDLALKTIRRIAKALDVRVDLTPRWRAGELDRLMNSKHSQLHESLARWFGDELPDWVLRPEVSFAVYGERGIIDILAWHPGRRALLVIELKTDIADVNELVGGVDRKRRLATGIARTMGWEPESVSVWVVVAAGRTKSSADRGPRGHASRGVSDGWPLHQAWLGDPTGPVAALSMWRDVRTETVTASPTPVRRVRRPSTSVAAKAPRP